MTIPNLGTTGLVQLSGIGGVIGQNLSALAQTLMARQQAEEERRRNEANAAYMKAQMESMAASRNRQAAQDAATAEAEAGLQRFMTPTTQQFTAPMFGVDGNVTAQMPASFQRQRSLEEVLPTVKPGSGAVTAFLEKAQPEIERREKTKKQKAMIETLGKISQDETRPALVRGNATLAATVLGATNDMQLALEFMRNNANYFNAEADTTTKAATAQYYRDKYRQLRNNPSDDQVNTLGVDFDKKEFERLSRPSRGTGPTEEEKRKKFRVEELKLSAKFRKDTAGLNPQSAKYIAFEDAYRRDVQAARLKYGQPEPPSTTEAPSPPPPNPLAEAIRRSARPNFPNVMVPRAGGR